MLNIIKFIVAVVIVIAGITAFYLYDGWPIYARYGVVVASVLVGLLVASLSTQGRAAIGFAAGSRSELRKVVWPTAKEAFQTTMMILVIVLLVGIMIWLVDWLLVNIIYNGILGVS